MNKAELEGCLAEVRTQADSVISKGRYLTNFLDDAKAREDFGSALHEVGLAIFTLSMVVADVIHGITPTEPAPKGDPIQAIAAQELCSRMSTDELRSFLATLNPDNLAIEALPCEGAVFRA